MSVDTDSLKRAAAGRWPEILSRLAGIDPALLDGRGHPCPVCKEGTNRFAVLDIERGALHCRKCFHTGNNDGIAALEWLNGWDFKTTVERLTEFLGLNNGNGKAHGPRKIVATYDYQDAAGVLVFQVLRYDPKDFQQRRPDGAGGWIYSVKGVPQVPYHLPELVAADPSAWIFLCEGEKDVDRLRGLGQVATTNAMGAKCWWPELTEHFRGRRVAMLLDNDPDGQARSAKVGPQLHGAAAVLKTIDLPGLPPKGDVSDWLNAGGTIEQLLAIVEAAPEWVPAPEPNKPAVKEEGQFVPLSPRPDSDNLPKINAGLQDLAAVTADAWDALHQANNPVRLFRHGGRLVRIERGDEGEPTLRELIVDRVRHELARAASWFKLELAKDGKTWTEKPAKPPIDVARDLLATPDPDLPKLVRIVEAPVFGADASLVSTPGYHEGNGTYYFADGLQVPAVSTSPLGDEVSDAVELLTFDLLGDFPFVSDSEKAHALALLLLPFCRDLIDGATPLHLVEAPTEGTGKGLLVEVLTIPAIGRPAAAMTEGRDEDEWRKRLTSKLRNGPVFVFIDNLKHTLESAAVSAAITADTLEDRIMGISEMVRMPVRCAWIATGNNPALSSEIARRTVRIRLDAKSPEPWLNRTFRHEDLRGWATENRGRLVWAALTLIQAWLAAGRPKGTNPRLGRCEAWSDVVGGILHTANVPGFLANLTDFYTVANADAALHKSLITAWWQTHGACKVGTTELWDVMKAEQIELDLGNGAEQSQRIVLGKLVASLRDRTYSIDTSEAGNITVRVLPAGKFRGAVQWQLAELKEQTP